MLANVHIGSSRERREMHTIAQLSFMLEKNWESENVSAIEALCFWLDIEVAQKLHFIYVWGRDRERAKDETMMHMYDDNDCSVAWITTTTTVASFARTKKCLCYVRNNRDLSQQIHRNKTFVGWKGKNR